MCVCVNWVQHEPTNQVFIRFVLKGELSPPDEGDLGEDVAPQQVSEQLPARFPGGAEDETAFIVLPEVPLQSLHVFGHAAKQSGCSLARVLVIQIKHIGVYAENVCKCRKKIHAVRALFVYCLGINKLVFSHTDSINRKYILQLDKHCNCIRFLRRTAQFSSN